MGERLDPEDLRSILTSFFSELSRQLQRYDGTVDKFIGDAIMAVFGAPIAHEDDAERAINAALSMHAAMAQLNLELERKYGTRLGLRIGINSGEVVAGLLAGDVQRAYTVVGDTVNTAQRFESVAAPGTILVSRSTRELSYRAFEFEEVPPQLLKGKSEPQPAYRVVRPLYRADEPRDTPLVGREAEQARIRTSVAAGLAGEGRLLHLVGDAGIGKSRLIHELLTGIDAEVMCVVGRCVSFEAERPYGLLARLLLDILHVPPTSEIGAVRNQIDQMLARVVAEPDPLETNLLLGVLGYGDAQGYEPQTRRRLLARLVRKLLGGYAAEAPLLIVAEDLHWMDAASTALLIEALPQIGGNRCVLVTTSRPTWMPPWPAEVVNLDALPLASTRALIDAAFGASVDEALADSILERTSGNPFFIEQVVRDLRAADVLVERQTQIMVRRGATLRVPATVQEVLEARLDRLPPGAKRVLQIAAVCGRVFRPRLVEQLAAPEVVTDSLALLERESFIRGFAAQPEPTFLFTHALVQEVAYNGQLQSQRRVLHTAIGDEIQRQYASRVDDFVDELAFHYRRGDDEAKAVYWLVRAGERAGSLFANQEALAYYLAALECTRDGQRPLAAGMILERIGDMQHLLGRYEEAISSFKAAREQIPSAELVTAGRLSRKIGTALRITGAYEEASRAFTAALATFGDDTHGEVARIFIQLGQLHWRTGAYSDAEEALSRAIQVGTALGLDDVLAEGLRQLGNIRFFTGDTGQAIQFYQLSRGMYERLKDVAGTAGVRLNIGMALARLQNWDDGLVEMRASLAGYQRIGDVWATGVVYNNIGELQRLRGDFATAIAVYQQAVSISTEIGYTAGVALALTGLGMARVQSGEIEQGRADLLEAEARFAALGRTMYFPELYRFLASAELAAGHLDAARGAAERSLEFARTNHVPDQEAITQRILAQIRLAQGKPGQARRLLQTSRTRLAELGETAELAETDAVLRSLGR